ncbi:MAG: glycoside hydrolase family 30 beta sandwich domain-containing protein [Bacteroidota bacterium]|nr:glycoside hydrolase family 30 beta sandwich domain-containing protein [Bacteroidota bacterium]
MTVSVNCNDLTATGFINPDGEIILVVLNQIGNKFRYNLKAEEKGT